MADLEIMMKIADLEMRVRQQEFDVDALQRKTLEIGSFSDAENWVANFNLNDWIIPGSGVWVDSSGPAARINAGRRQALQTAQKNANSTSTMSGDVIRNGERVSVASDVDVDSMGTSTTNYIYGRYTTGGTDDPAAYPTGFSITSGTTWPVAGTDARFKEVIRLATATIDGDDNMTLDREYEGGDIADSMFVPDSDTRSSAANQHRTIFLRTAAGHRNELTLYATEALTSNTVDTGKAAYVDLSSGLDLRWDHIVKYRGAGIIGGIAHATQSIEMVKGLGNTGSGNTISWTSDIVNITDGKVDFVAGEGGSIHLTIDFAGGTFSGDISWANLSDYVKLHHDEMDPTAGASPYSQANWNANTDHDRRYMFVQSGYNDGDGVGTNSADFYTSGQIRAGAFRVIDDTTNEWSAATFVVDTTDMISMVGTQVWIQTDVSTITLYAATSIGLEAHNGDITAEFFGGFGDFIVDGGDIELADATGEIRINATKVVDARITGWGTPTGTGARTALASHATQDITNPPTETEVQNIDDSLVATSQALHQLIDDLISHGLIGA